MANDIVAIDQDKTTFNIVVLTDNIENQNLTDKVAEYIRDYYGPESKSLTILFVAVYKTMLNSNRKKVKVFSEWKIENTDLIVEVENYSFTTSMLREKIYNFISENNLVIVKIK